MTDAERPCRNTVNKSLLLLLLLVLLLFIIILQAVEPKKGRTYNCFHNALMGSHNLLTDPLLSLQSPSGSRTTLMSILFCTDL